MTKPPLPKYSIGEKVFHMENNKIRHFEINGMYYGYTYAGHENTSPTRWHYTYSFDLPDRGDWKIEDQLFSSEKEVVESLLK